LITFFYPESKPAVTGSWISRWWGRGEATPGPIKASLGEEKTFYYDKDLKRWVNKKVRYPPFVANAVSTSVNNFRLVVRNLPNSLFLLHLHQELKLPPLEGLVPGFRMARLLAHLQPVLLLPST